MRRIVTFAVVVASATAAYPADAQDEVAATTPAPGDTPDDSNELSPPIDETPPPVSTPDDDSPSEAVRAYAAERRAAEQALERLYDRAFRAFVTGDLTVAIRDLEQIAAVAQNSDLRSRASELSRLARQLERQREMTGAALTAAGDPDEGRIEFLTTSTLAGAYGGVALVDLFDIDFRPAVLVIAATTGTGFLGSVLATRKRSMSQGTAEAWTLGLLVGASNGLLLADPVGAGDRDETMGFSWLTLAAGGGASLLYSDIFAPTPAQVALTGTIGYMGLATIGLGMVVITPDRLTDDATRWALAAGLDVGSGVGIGLSKDLQWSTTRSRLVSFSAVLGTIAGAATYALIGGEPNGDTQLRLFATSTLVGAWAGLGLGVRFTRGMAPPPNDSIKQASAPVAVTPLVVDGGGGLNIGGLF